MSQEQDETTDTALEKPPHPLVRLGQQIKESVGDKISATQHAIAEKQEEIKAKQQAAKDARAQKKVKIDWAAWKKEVEQRLQDEITSLREEVEAIKADYEEYRFYMSKRGYPGLRKPFEPVEEV